MDFASEYANMAVQARFEDIPPHTVEMTKRFVLDTLGVGIAGSARDEAKKAVEIVRKWGGKEESTVLVFGDRLPVIHSVFANSVMFHALDFDDTHDGAVVHGYVTNFSAALAVAESLGGVSGKDLIVALNLGLDLTCRLGLAIGSAPEFGSKEVNFIRSAVCGCFGACIVAGKLLGLSADEMVNALGIVLSQVGGTRQVVVDSAMTKRFQPAFAAKAGVLSALLSASGIGGCKEVFEGKYGYFNIYWEGAYLREELTRDLGHHFEGVNSSFKPYPCCRYTHGAIEAALQCVDKYGVSAEAVEKVVVHVPMQIFFDVVSRPFSIGNNPAIDGQFSIPYTVASALLDSSVFLGSFEAETVKEERRKRLAEKVEVLMDQPVKDKRSLGPVIVDIHTFDGKLYSHKVEDFKGSPGRPMTRGDCIEKFMRCSRYVGSPFPEEKLKECISMVYDMDRLEDATGIMKLLAKA